jgi:hypothetical protein
MDIDGDDGESGLRKLEAENGQLPITVEAGGRKSRASGVLSIRPTRCRNKSIGGSGFACIT